MKDVKIKIGCDIVKVDRLEEIGTKSLMKIFYEHEVEKSSLESIAGILAVKESCRKVFNGLRWHDIKVSKDKEGKPSVTLNIKKLNKIKILSQDVSISHDGDYAMAVAVFMLKGN